MSLVFISHAAEDATLAVQIARGLEDAGCPTWYYERDSLPGPSYLGQILHALAQATATVVLVSPAALASGQVEKEVVQAHERGVAFVPLLHGVGYEALRAQRPEWAMAFGAAVALPLPAAADVASVLPQIVAGLRWLAGERPMAAPVVATEGRAATVSGPPVDNVPMPPTPLVGREQAVAQLAALVRQPEARLVTLTGPGGVGKTRLAIAVAQATREDFADGVGFVDLAPLTDPALVLSAIAQALGIKEGGGQPLSETLGAALRERALLLVVDNVEQVVAATPHIATLLAGCPRLTVLATSRVPMHLRGEREIAVPPLDVPDPSRLPVLDALAQVAAVALFAARAQEAKADFALAEANAAAVAAICARLDGLPLAIELAAARIKLLPPPALLARLGDRLAVLVGGARDLPERQRTLRATIDWSYELLGPDEQRFFARLAVFVGGRTWEAVEAVCNHDGTLDVLAGLEALVAQSLVQEVEEAGEMRFVLLETLHEYARERLAERGETEELRRVHAAYFLALVEEAAAQLTGPEQARSLGRLEREHDNLRAALGWAEERGEDETGLRLAGALWRFWQIRGYPSEGRRWLEGFLGRASSALSAGVRAQGLIAAAEMAVAQSDDETATHWAEEALALARQHGNTEMTARALRRLGLNATRQGDPVRGQGLLEESLALYQDLGYARDVAVSLGLLALAIRNQGDIPRAAALFAEAGARAQEVGDLRAQAMALSNQGLMAHFLGHEAQAAALYQQSLRIARELGDKAMLAALLINLGDMARAQGEVAEAAAHYAASLPLAQEVRNRQLVAYVLEGIGGIAVARGHAERAAHMLAAAAHLRQMLGVPLEYPEEAVYERDVATAREQLGEQAFAAAWAQGEALPLAEAVMLAQEEVG